MFKKTLILLILIPWAAQSAVVQGVRVWHSPDQSRVVLELSAATNFDVFTVANPDRVVVDLKASTAARDLGMPAGDARVRSLRHARFNQGKDLRLVFETGHTVSVRKALLPPHAPYGHRLVIDLVDPEPGSPLGAPSPSNPPLPEPAPLVASPVERVATTAASVPVAIEQRVSPASPSSVAKPQTPTLIKTTGAKTKAPVRPWTIAVDAGHGGEDVGAIGMRGTYEKDVVLALARELARQINAEPGFRAVLVRDGDYYIELRDRMVRARRHRADLFVSIHADAFRNRRVSGASVYVLSTRGASSEAARWLAERENAADLVGGVTLEDKDSQLRSVLLDMSQTASLEASLRVGENVLHALKQVGKVHRDQVQAAGFMVLKSPDIPSLLVETAYISNPSEEQMLRDQRFRGRMAGAIKEGVKAFFQGRTLPGQRYAQMRRHMVSQGDTLSRIAARYDVSTSQILAANNRRDPTVRLGEVLRIP
jgi:N-acetylmuramoyl-L-alanine amidase